MWEERQKAGGKGRGSGPAPGLGVGSLKMQLNLFFLIKDVKARMNAAPAGVASSFLQPQIYNVREG